VEKTMAGGSPNFVLHSKSYLFFDVKLRAKFQNPRTTPFERKVCGTEQQEKNHPKNNESFVPQQRLSAAHKLRSDQFYQIS
jgi:hypothetical protein